MSDASLVWLRQDLRLEDNPAIRAAVERGGPLIPVYLWSPEEDGTWAPGAASRWWLHRSLQSLDGALRSRGSRLILRRGNALQALLQLMRESGARAVFWNRRYEPMAVQSERDIQKRLREAGCIAESFNGSLLFEPWELCTRSGAPFRVFTPFWRSCLAQPAPVLPSPMPATLPQPVRWPESLPLESLRLLPSVNWAGEFERTWRPGEAGAVAALEEFLGRAVPAYAVARDHPDRRGTSRLSPHLHFGEISPRRIWHEVQELSGRSPEATASRGVEAFVRQLGWREFAHHVLFHFPHTAEKPMRSEFAAFPWARRPRDLEAWRHGLTGYPLVDAGMRELWATGWMHNRVRMLVASFLVKDLRVHWLEGARWFWDTLVDADLADNTMGWQWSAGCGADAAPYFRIFNPVTQGEKFDPEGTYVRQWVPELARLTARWIHRPFEAPDAVLAAAEVRLGKDYPRPLVDHAEARARALAALSDVSRDEED